MDRNTAMELADLMDSNSDQGQWNGADICDDLARLIADAGGWNQCSEHGAFSSSKTHCPWCRVEDTITIEVTGYPGGPYVATLTDPEEPYGTPFSEAKAETARAAVLALVGMITMVGE